MTSIETYILIMVGGFIVAWLLGNYAGYVVGWGRRGYAFNWRVFVGPDTYIRWAVRN